MTLDLKLFAISLFGVICAGIFFIAFGQITVRKLRKNPETKDRLGIEFASGLDILNVAQALSLPRAWSRIIDRGPLSMLWANSEVLYRNTTKFDRCLARTFYWLLVGSACPLLTMAIINALG